MAEDFSDEPMFRNIEWEGIIEKFEKPLTMISGPLAMANKFAESLSNAKNANFHINVPKGAEEWAEAVFEKYFELMGLIAKEGGVRNSLLDRDLYDPLMDNSPEWSKD